MREPCGYHAGRHPHDTYSNDAQINVPAKKSLAVVNVAVSDRERRIASQAPMCTDSVELQCIWCNIHKKTLVQVARVLRLIVQMARVLRLIMKL